MKVTSQNREVSAGQVGSKLTLGVAGEKAWSQFCMEHRRVMGTKPAVCMQSDGRAYRVMLGQRSKRHIEKLGGGREGRFQKKGNCC